MKITTACSLVLAASMIFSCQALAAGKDTDLGPEKVTLKTAAAENPAEFPHYQHQLTVVCLKCHHVEGRTMTTQRCINCHNETMPDEQLNDLKKVGHALCRTCHKKAAEEGKAAPTRCSGCHPLKMKKSP